MAYDFWLNTKKNQESILYNSTYSLGSSIYRKYEGSTFLIGEHVGFLCVDDFA